MIRSQGRAHDPLNGRSTRQGEWVAHKGTNLGRRTSPRPECTSTRSSTHAGWQNEGRRALLFGLQGCVVGSGPDRRRVDSEPASAIGSLGPHPAREAFEPAAVEPVVVECMMRSPTRLMAWPVIYSVSSDARNAARSATSFGVARQRASAFRVGAGRRGFRPSSPRSHAGHDVAQSSRIE
jgi:hypothetical protein